VSHGRNVVDPTFTDILHHLVVNGWTQMAQMNADNCKKRQRSFSKERSAFLFCDICVRPFTTTE